MFGAYASVALVNPAVRGEPTDAAAFLTLGAGERLAAPDETGPTMIEGGVARAVSDLAAEAYTLKAFEGRATRDSYFRRFGVPLPAGMAVADVGVPVLRGAQGTATQAARVGALGKALRRAGRRVAVYGQWQAALVGMDAGGLAPVGSIYRPVGPKQIPATLLHADVAFVYAPDKEFLLRYAKAALPLARRNGVDVLIVEAAPPRTADGDKWTRVGWILAAGPSFPRGDVLFSPTTRTPGLIANIDLAPTVLALQNASAFDDGRGSGRAAYPVRVKSAWGTVSRIDAQATATAKAWTPLMVAYAVLAIGSGLLALLALQIENEWLGRIARGGLLAAAAVPIALMPVGWLAPPTITKYLVGVFAVAAVLAVAAFYAGRWRRVPPVTLLFALLVAVVMVDALFGAPLEQRAVNNLLPGVRFYGVGNEYLGFSVGAALVLMGLLAEDLPAWATPALSVVLMLLISLPWFGAKAGGALVATFAFVLAAYARRKVPVRGRQIVAALGCALVALAAVAGLDALRPDSARSHIGAAVASGQAHGVGALGDIALRKLGMNVAIATNPWTGVALLGLVPIWLLLGRGGTRKRAQDALRARPAFAALLPVAGWSALVALLFNDAGMVAALLLLACPTAALLLLMLDEAL